MLVFPERVLQRRPPEPRLPPPLRAREPVGAGRRVQGRSASRCSPSASFGARAADAASCSASTRSRATGAATSRSRCALISLLIIVRRSASPRSAWVGAVGARSARARRGPGGAPAPADDPRRAGCGARSPACSSASRCCSGPTCPRGRPRPRRRCSAVSTGARRSVAARRRRRSASRRTSIHARSPPARAPSIDGMILDPVFYLRGGRRLPIPPPWDHLDGFLQRAGHSSSCRGRSRALNGRSSSRLVLLPPRQSCCSCSSSHGVAAGAGSAARSTRPVLAGGRRVQRRAPPAGDPAGRLRALRVGELRAVRVPPGRDLRGRSAAWTARARPRQLASPGGRGRARSSLVLVIPTFTVARYTDYSLQSFGYHRIAYEIEHEGASSTTASPKSRRGGQRCDRRGGAHLEPGRPAVRRARPTCARRRTATRTSTTCCPTSTRRRTTSRWTPASPTPRLGARRRPARRPTSRSCRRSGTTGTSPTTPASSAPTSPTSARGRDFCLVGTYRDRYELTERCDRHRD